MPPIVHSARRTSRRWAASSSHYQCLRGRRDEIPSSGRLRHPLIENETSEQQVRHASRAPFGSAVRSLSSLVQFQRTPPNLALLRTADERSIEVGSSVHAIGHPDGQQWTYTQGVISQVRSDFRWKDNNDLQHSATVIQTQTPINPGSSGGPLLDDKVAVVGVNTFFRAEKQGLNFAISVGEIKRFLEMRDNREGTTHERKAEPPRDTESCNQKDHRQFPPLQDPITKKKLCRLTRSVSVARIFGELVIHQSMCSGTV